MLKKTYQKYRMYTDGTVLHEEDWGQRTSTEFEEHILPDELVDFLIEPT